MEERPLRALVSFILLALLSTNFIFAQRSKKDLNKGNIGQYGLISFSRPIKKDSIISIALLAGEKKAELFFNNETILSIVWLGGGRGGSLKSIKIYSSGFLLSRGGL